MITNNLLENFIYSRLRWYLLFTKQNVSDISVFFKEQEQVETLIPKYLSLRNDLGSSYIQKWFISILFFFLL